MQVLARTYHVAHGVPPRRFAVTFELHGERRVHVACDNGAARCLKWNGTGYRPGSGAHLNAVIEKYLQLEQRDGQVEQVNAELLYADRERPAKRHNGNERALPVGDRG